MPVSTKTYFATATASARNSEVITISASASAGSKISYDNAYQIALANAKVIAQENANNQAANMF